MQSEENGEGNLVLYKETLRCLEVAAVECEKTSNVDLVTILNAVSRGNEFLNRLKETETNDLRKNGILQLTTTLSVYYDLLSRKLDQLSNATQNEPEIESTSPNPKPEADKETRGRKSAIEDTIIQKGNLKFDDVAGLKEAKQALTEAIIMPLQYPQLFTGGRKPWKRILLYGPPGTGKSRLAHAVSSEIESTFYCVSSADLVSSWVGESEKLIKELFHHARNQKGRSVIFIDEIDSICRKRSAQEEEHTRRIKTELLKQMEGAGNDDKADKIFLLCATNCPWEIDTAFLRRFQKRIYIPLPDQVAREALVRIHTEENPLSFTKNDWRLLVEKTKGYSGSDISNMVLGALFEPVRELQNAMTWRHTSDGKLIPCSGLESDSKVIRAKITDLPPEQVHTREVKVEDFLISMKSHQNTVTVADLEKFQQFTQHFGQNG